jgi:hypothetical protein
MARDFQQQLARQLGFIENSCRAYDAGDKDEAIRLATSARVIFHDSRSSTSLLNHLNATSVAMLSATITHEPHKSSPHSLVSTRWIAGKEGYSEPLLETAPSRVFIPLSDWWGKEVVFYSGPTRVTRNLLVLSAANKDGGAHVDADLNAEYEAVINGLGMAMKWQHTDEETQQPVGDSWVTELRDTHLAGLRHIAYEVLNSPDILRLVGRGIETGTS